MEMDDRTKARLDAQRNARCLALAVVIEQRIGELNKLLAEAAELELSVRIEAEQKKSGTRAFQYAFFVSCAQILP